MGTENEVNLVFRIKYRTYYHSDFMIDLCRTDINHHKHNTCVYNVGTYVACLIIVVNYICTF